jgi:hypothetical protein
MTNSRRNEITKIEIAPSGMKLPDEFNIQPTYTVELTSGYKVEVFKTDRPLVHRFEGKTIETENATQYRLVLRTKKGQLVDMNRAPAAVRDLFYSRDTLADPLSVKHKLEQVDHALTKKKVTQMVEQAFGDED